MSNATHCIPWNADCSICNPPRGQTHYEGCERTAVDALDRAREELASSRERENARRVTDTDLTAWLIEVPQSGGAMWWTGQEDGDGTMPDESRLAWLKFFSTDANKAVRFRSGADAHAVLRLLPQCWKLWTYPAVVTEHRWCNGPDLAARAQP